MRPEGSQPRESTNAGAVPQDTLARLGAQVGTDETFVCMPASCRPACFDRVTNT